MASNALCPMRPTTAVETMGPVGASFSVYETNWECPSCKAQNFARREKCIRCKAAKPAGAQGVEMSTALVAGIEGKETKWREALDPNSHQLYYFHTETQETSWARPAEMGPAPFATGYYGRGTAGDTSQAEYVAKNSEWLKRPARVQSKAIDPKRLQRAEGANEMNIWYAAAFLLHNTHQAHQLQQAALLQTHNT